MLRDFARIPPHNVLTGQVTAAMADMLPCPYRTATILREPVQRSLSMLGQSDGAMLARATRRLETLDFVGLTERFVESCALFDARFGTAVSRSVRRELVHRPEGSELAEFIPRLEPFLEHDRALYERAQAAFVPAG